MRQVFRLGVLGIRGAAFCSVCFLTFLLCVGSMGIVGWVVLCVLLSWHWSPIKDMHRRLEIGCLGGIGALPIGVCLVGPRLEIDVAGSNDLFFLMIGLLMVAGGAAHWFDRWSKRAGIFSAMGSWTLAYVIFVVAVLYEPFGTAGLAAIIGRGEAEWSAQAVFCPLLGVVFSLTDQLRERGRVSLLETYIVSCVFGAMALSALRFFSLEAQWMLVLFTSGLVVGVLLWALDEHAASRTLSTLKGTLNGLFGGFLAYGFGFLIEEMYGFIAYGLSFGMALIGAYVSFRLGIFLARCQGRSVVVNPILMSPVPAALIGLAIGAIIHYVWFL